MDFTNRASQPQMTGSPASSTSGATTSNKHNKVNETKWSRVVMVLAVTSVAVLVLAVLAVVSFGGVKAEDNFVNKDKLQAVFLNTGQVYFGKVKSLNSKYLVLDNIYYLQTTQNGTDKNSTSISLVKLGCELHEPYDRMVINRDQVTFWENLQDNGQVAQAVSKFVKANPDGQKCADQSQAGNSQNNVQNTNSSSSSSSSSTTKKP
ncbi:MAG TPA: hypothetical protein VLG37_05540 [Candidatus Saccharimonadales bacterium]|nr:hypothetical protein [Candidatus Saccharimonadales bacterium]